MPIKWTKDQQSAIDVRGNNVLVSAAAGSGKTAVLVERVIKRITDNENPVQIDRMLIATFTNAAANGMQIKIRAALKKQLDKNNGGDEYLAKQLALLPRASITTVHSFCQDLIRNNFHKLGLCATFEIGDETQLSILKEQAMDIVFESRYDSPSSEFETLVSAFGGKRDDSSLTDIVQSIYNFTQSTASPEKWLEASKNKYNAGGFFEWSGYILSSLEHEIIGMINAYDNAIEVIDGGNGIEKYYDLFCLERDCLCALLEKCDTTWDEMRDCLQSIQFGRLPSKSKEADAASASYVQGIRNSVKKQIGKMCGVLFSSQTDIQKDNIILGNIAKELCDIVSDFAKEYIRLKREKNLVDFNDLEHYTLELLSDSDIANQLKDKYDEVLVDEYQDTNGVQEAIFQAISKGDNLFMVGDVKQSIYGFRNAQPSIFTTKAKKYVENCDLGIQLNLSHNFRSCSDIIHFVNNIFASLMTEGIGGVDYNNGHSLICGRKTACSGKSVEFHIIDKKLEENDELTEDELLTDEIVREAMFVARRIVELVEVEKPHIIINDETGETRKLQYSDIAILARKNKGVSNIFAQQLAQFGVPFYCEDETGNYIISQEISTILSFLQIIDNPLQDIPLLAVMRSPMFLFTDEELAKIKVLSKESFYDAVCKCGSDKCVNFIKALEHYREISTHESIEFVIRSILSDTGFLSFTGALPNGETRVANLRLLCERAGRFEAGEYKSIFDFVNYISAMTQHSQGYSVAKVSGQNDNVVHMMSIHKSKGLEFPVVFLVRCGERFNKSDLSASMLYDIDLGLGCDFIDTERGIKYPSVAKLAISQKKLFSLLSEELRVMYTALTRPKDMLFIIGSCVNIEEKISGWENSVVSPYTVSLQNTYLDWLGLALNSTVRSFAKIHSANDIVLKNRAGVAMQTFSNDEISDCYSDEVAKRLEYKYKYSGAVYIPSKLPVSQAANEVEYTITLKKPSFMQKQERMSAALRGSVIHFVMQNIDIQKTSSHDEIKLQLETMVDNGMIDASFAEIIDANALGRFFSSEIGQRMKASDKVEREVKFFVDVPAHEIISGLDENVSGETILLQGVVDCYFEENGEIVILDYKTGNANNPDYEKQIKFYALGLSRVLNKKVKETVVYPLI